MVDIDFPDLKAVRKKIMLLSRKICFRLLFKWKPDYLSGEMIIAFQIFLDNNNAIRYHIDLIKSFKCKDVWTNPHVDAHFATCFTSLVIIRLLQARLGNKFPVSQILKSLRSYNCLEIDPNHFQFIYFDEILATCEKEFGMKLNSKYATRLEIRRMLKY
jgi:hypothetical protein